ncbi:MAG: eCIS core domain-containing protein [Trueperaceae bacterium]
MSEAHSLTRQFSGLSPARITNVMLQRKCACGGTLGLTGECENCRKKRETREQSLQRAAVDSSPVGDVPPIVHDVLQSPGQPLDKETRAFMEPRFGHDFSQVRIHADAKAAESARAVKARAYTAGHHIAFAGREYQPTTRLGQQLLAHELTHVVQQQQGLAKAGIDSPYSSAEREADNNARLLHSSAHLQFTRPPSVLARQADSTTTTVQEPTGPNDCRLEQHHAIEPAVHESLNWLQQAVSKLDAFITTPNQASNADARNALQRHFHTVDPTIARQVRDRLETIRTDMTSRNPFTVECHTDTDSTCSTSGAYVPGDNRSMIVFCPTFFSSSISWRVETLIHEMAHTLLGGPHITDRGYGSDRVLPYLSTAEALTNAESFAFLAQELGTGSVPQTNPPTDDIASDCGSQVTQLVQIAIARAQRWNRDSENISGDAHPDMINNSADLFTRHLGNNTPATRAAALQVYRSMVNRLHSSIDVRCDSKNCGSRRAYGRTGSDNMAAGAITGGILGGLAGGIVGGLLGGLAGVLLGGLLGVGLGMLIGTGIGALASSSPQVYICPTWKDQASEADRIESMLAAIYEAHAGLNAADSLKYAQLARAINASYFKI